MAEVELEVRAGDLADEGRGVARLSPAELERAGLREDDVVLVVGKHLTAARAAVARPGAPSATVALDSLTRANAGVGPGDFVELRRAESVPAERIELEATEPVPAGTEFGSLAAHLDGLVVVGGDRVRCTLPAGQVLELTVRRTHPPGTVLVTAATEVGRREDREEVSYGRAVRYAEVGGLGRQLDRVRELIELPLRHPMLFDHLGIEPPRGVLLHGPPGCGKTLIARAIAHESEASFFPVSGPEVIHHFYGESEAHLRNLFKEASQAGPSIIFLDEIESIAPRRDKVSGEVEKRLVAQLLALMDGLTQRERILVIAATNLPHAIDPALRRPGRFDREIPIPPPDRAGRREILSIHTRRMPLTEDVDLDHLAAITHGFVGADLAALAREAAMARLRRAIPKVEEAAAWLASHHLPDLQVTQGDFLAALVEVGPSALRELVADLPEVGWDEVGGLREVKRKLREAVEWPLRHPETFEQMAVRPSRGLLLTGPPGSGKTLLAKAVATASGANFIVIRGPELYSRYVGESEKSLRDVFHKARLSAPCVLLFDEMDGLFPRRGGGSSTSEVGERLLGHFLAELDGVEELTDVFVLAASNRPDRLDPALTRPGRFDGRIELPPPELNDRREIFEIHLRGKPLAGGVDLEALAARSKGMMGSDIAEVCRRASLRAIRRLIRGEGEPEVRAEDLLEGLEELEGERLGVEEEVPPSEAVGA